MLAGRLLRVLRRRREEKREVCVSGMTFTSWPCGMEAVRRQGGVERGRQSDCLCLACLTPGSTLCEASEPLHRSG